jgi:hypothetical protein
MIGADREMQRVTGPHAERVLIGKPRSGAELSAGDRQHSEGFRAHRGEHGERIRPALRLDLPRSQLDRQRRGIER